jgi:hypothetical protein
MTPAGLRIEEPKSLLLGSTGIRREPVMTLQLGNRGAKVSLALVNWNKTRTSYDTVGLGIKEPKSLLLGSIRIRREPFMTPPAGLGIEEPTAKVSLAWLNWNKSRTGYDPTRRLGNRGTLRLFP